LPAHPIWFWLVLAVPFLLLLLVWVAANTLKVSLKPATRWLWVGYVLFAIPYLLMDLMDGMNGHKALRLVAESTSYTCLILAIWIQKRYKFETLRGPDTKWYLPRKAAEFSLPANTRVLVRDIDSVSPWYTEKLGLRKLTENDRGESGIATFRFKADGNAVVLTMNRNSTTKTPMLFTKRIARMKNVLAARGVEVGTIERDRQRIQYFQIQDPEGNEIEVVHEP